MSGRSVVSASASTGACRSMLTLGRYFAAVERLDVPDVACCEHGVRTLLRRDGIEVVRAACPCTPGAVPPRFETQSPGPVLSGAVICSIVPPRAA